MTCEESTCIEVHLQNHFYAGCMEEDMDDSNGGGESDWEDEEGVTPQAGAGLTPCLACASTNTKLEGEDRTELGLLCRGFCKLFKIKYELEGKGYPPVPLCGDCSNQLYDLLLVRKMLRDCRKALAAGVREFKEKIVAAEEEFEANKIYKRDERYLLIREQLFAVLLENKPNSPPPPPSEDVKYVTAPSPPPRQRKRRRSERYFKESVGNPKEGLGNPCLVAVQSLISGTTGSGGDKHNPEIKDCPQSAEESENSVANEDFDGGNRIRKSNSRAKYTPRRKRKGWKPTKRELADANLVYVGSEDDEQNSERSRTEAVDGESDIIYFGPGPYGSTDDTSMRQSEVRNGKRRPLPADCPICGKPFTTVNRMRRHKYTHFNPQDMADAVKRGETILPTKRNPKVECDQCGKILSRKRKLTHHKKVFHSSQSQTKPKETLSENETDEEIPFACEICGKGFRMKRHLRRQESMHSNDKSFQCPLCQKVLTSKRTLNEHMLRHKNKRPFKCSLCYRAYLKSGHLKRHEQDFHGKV